MQKYLLQLPDVIPELPGVYRLFNTHSQESYVGGTKNLLRRAGQHRQKLLEGRHTYRIQEHCENYPGCFSFEILEVCDTDQLVSREQHWVDRIKPFLNTRSKAQACFRRQPVTEQVRAVIALVRKETTVEQPASAGK